MTLATGRSPDSVTLHQGMSEQDQLDIDKCRRNAGADKDLMIGLAEQLGLYF